MLVTTKPAPHSALPSAPSGQAQTLAWTVQSTTFQPRGNPRLCPFVQRQLRLSRRRFGDRACFRTAMPGCRSESSGRDQSIRGLVPVRAAIRVAADPACGLKRPDPVIGGESSGVIWHVVLGLTVEPIGAVRIYLPYPGAVFQGQDPGANELGVQAFRGRRAGAHGVLRDVAGINRR